MGDPPDPVTVSVIVPCHNGARYARQLLESLAGQVVDEPTEIIVIDNGSTDNSARIASEVSAAVPIRVITARTRLNASYARNVGVNVARGEKLLFVDIDDEVAPGYVAAMSAALDTHEFVTSRVDSDVLNPEWVRRAHGEPWQAEGIITFFGFLPAAGVNIGLRRPLFARIGGFPEDFTGSQDIVFSWRAQLHGASLHFVREAVYHYRYRDSLPGLFRQARNWGMSNVRLYRSFRCEGMPGRTAATAIDEWWTVISRLMHVRTRADAAPLIVRFGYCVGRLVGSIRYRTAYF